MNGSDGLKPPEQEMKSRRATRVRLVLGTTLALAILLVAVALAAVVRDRPGDDLRAGRTARDPDGSGETQAGERATDGSTAPTVPTTTSGAGRGTTAPPRPTPTSPPKAAECTATRRDAGAAVTVHVDGSSRFQVMDGFGTTVRLFDDPHLTETFDQATGRAAVVVPRAAQDDILDRLYGDLKLNRVRPATDGGVEVTNDNGDPDVTDISRFNFAWKRNDDFVDYQKRVAPRGVTQVFLSPVSLEPWQKVSTPAEYAEWALVVIRRWRSLGVDLPYFSVVNEPGGTPAVSGEFIRDVIKILGPKLRAEGLQTRMMVPDDINPSQALGRLRTILVDPVARPYVGAVAYHLYGSLEGRSEITALAAEYGLPVWMTEFYQPHALDWANTVHESIEGNNASAVDYLWGFFGQWARGGDQLITINHTGNQYTGYTVNKQYYVFGQFSRFVAPGSQRVAATSSDRQVRVTAFVKDGTTVVVAINNDSLPRPTEFGLSGVPCGGQVRSVRTSASESWQDLPAVPVGAGRFSATLAPGSVTTFTTSG